MLPSPHCRTIPDIRDITDSLIESYKTHPYLTNHHEYRLPSRNCVSDMAKNLESLIFPGLVECNQSQSSANYFSTGNLLTKTLGVLIQAIENAFGYAYHCQNHRYILPKTDLSIPELAEELALTFLRHLPVIREELHIDMHAAYRGDPAAKSYAEIILSYPGFRALTYHRLARKLHVLGVPMIPRMMSELVHTITGIDIHPGAKIGSALFIDHGTGVVIGETTVIGNHVKIYQGVTLGALSIPDPDIIEPAQRHPTIEDDVTIYAGATILGGETVVGARSVVGSNVWLSHSVPPDTRVLFVPPELRIKTKPNGSVAPCL